MPHEFKVDPDRVDIHDHDKSGINVRAVGTDGRKGIADIVMLDRPSLLAWLKSSGGNNTLAENTVGILLGHGHLHPTCTCLDGVDSTCPLHPEKAPA